MKCTPLLNIITVRGCVRGSMEYILLTRKHWYKISINEFNYFICLGERLWRLSLLWKA